MSDILASALKACQRDIGIAEEWVSIAKDIAKMYFSLPIGKRERYMRFLKDADKEELARGLVDMIDKMRTEQ